MKSWKPSQPRLIVVGRRSYIGAHLIEHAKRAGRENVIGLASADCNFLDARSVKKFFRSLGRDEYTVVFLAVVNKHVRNSFDSFVDNMTMVRNLTQGCRFATVTSLLYFSSVDVYGNRPEVPITERTPVAPDTWYGLAKYTGEWIVASSGDMNCPVTVLRIPGIYGRARNDPSVIGRMVSGIRKDGRVRIRGSGRARRDYVFIGDLARLVLELTGARYNGVLNVASGQSRSLLEVVRIVGRELGGGFEVVHESGDSSRDFDLVFDNARLRSLFPDFRFSDLSVGVRSYLAGEARAASIIKKRVAA